MLVILELILDVNDFLLLEHVLFLFPCTKPIFACRILFFTFLTPYKISPSLKMFFKFDILFLTQYSENYHY